MNTIRKNSWVFHLCVLVFGFFMCNSIILLLQIQSLLDSLTGNQTITSRGNNFELGFFKPGKSRNHYIGIWYKKVSVQTVVWVANRDAPITDPSSSKFTVLNGNLVLLNNTSKTPIWSTNLASNNLNTTQVVLGDDGNLVLRDGSNPSAVSWQSFDYPTDTWLPGSKIGFRKKTNQTYQLTSWRSREDPAMGFYNWALGPNRTLQQVIYWNKTEEIWKTGEWDEKSEIFLLLPEMRLNIKFKTSLNSNVDESYFTYKMYNKSSITRLVMDITGQIREFKWSEAMRTWTLVWGCTQTIV
ncbi:hypothetical protein MKX03_027164 [Papaver bracteatum]|nr:hypothetical protein MKX03_027164 [Papaver bracteatum]